MADALVDANLDTPFIDGHPRQHARSGGLHEVRLTGGGRIDGCALLTCP